MRIWYLYHSSFLVEFEKRVLIFDYFKDKPRHHGLTDGVVDPEELADYEVNVFVTHRHADHYNPIIYGWNYDIRRLRFIMSPDILAIPEEVKSMTIHPDKTSEVDDIQITGFESNDEGLAYLIKMPEVTIFFAGDLNWWDWPGETAEYRSQMQDSYCREINKLIGEEIDVAFIPVDPRLRSSYAKGLDYFMRTVDAKVCVPMHMDGDYTVCKQLLEDPCTRPYRDKLAVYSKRGEILKLPPDLEAR